MNTSPKELDLSLHSYCMRYHFAHDPEFGPIEFMDFSRNLGFAGINLSLNGPDCRHLGGCEPWRMDAVREHLASTGLSLEIDTSGTDYAHLREMIDTAKRIGAATMRLYTRHGGTTEYMVEKTTTDLRNIVHYAEDTGIILVLENHEDFTGREITRIIESVNHPNLKALYDYGNSQIVLEDPLVALDAMLPHVHSVHVKDHVLIRDQDSPTLETIVAGATVGRGFLPIELITEKLLSTGLRRLCFESVWGYSVGFTPNRVAGPNVVVGKDSFAFAEPGFAVEDIELEPDALPAEELLRLERNSVVVGLAWFRKFLEKCGYTTRAL